MLDNARLLEARLTLLLKYCPGRLIRTAPRANDRQVDDWDFDPFELDTVTQGHPMVTLGAYLFEAKYNFFSSFGLSKARPGGQLPAPRLR